MAEALVQADHEVYSSLVARYEHEGIRILPYDHPAFPSHVHELEDPPLALFVRGNLPPARAVAVIGTRELSTDGNELIRGAVLNLVSARYAVLSGLAHGADTVAHSTAIENNGTTVAILPGAVDAVVPRDNQGLADRIVAAGGGLVAEVTSIKPLHKGRFIQRNRLISALSSATVVAETGPEGGSWHQVRYSLRQGKPVFALQPDPTNHRAVQGFKLLCKTGAVPVADPRVVAEAIERHRPSVHRSLLDF